VQILIDVAGQGSYKVVPFPEEKKKIDIGSAYCSYSKIKKELGWEPRVDLRDGLKRTVEYYNKYKQYYW
jgi:UDP-glucose 4-epimerase